MKDKVLQRLGLIILIAIAAASFAVPSDWFGQTKLGNYFAEKKVTLGLDLAGGAELDYKIDLTQAIAQNNDANFENDVNIDQIAESVRDSLEKRVNPAGVGEILVKRSTFNDQEHILIQMPPSANLEEAKSSAEQDNSLEFFKENPDGTLNKRIELATILTKELTANNWDAKVSEWEKDTKNTVKNTVSEAKFQDEITDTKLAEQLFKANAGEVVQELIDSQTDMAYTINDEGQLTLTAYPRKFLGFAKVLSKEAVEREKTTPVSMEARHILFGYKGASRADENIPYETKEEAKAKAESVLAELIANNAVDFDEKAKTLSTEPGADQSGGSLGVFGPGQMVQPFEEAIKTQAAAGLIPTLVETDFGFHIIDVVNFEAEKTETQTEDKITYETFGWDPESFIWDKTALDGSKLEVAAVGYNEINQPTVNLLFNEEGAELFANLTKEIAAQTCNEDACRLGIKVGGQWRTRATVREQISGGKAQISGSYDFERAKQEADSLNLGAIDAPVSLSGQTTIQPTLGKAQLDSSLKAAGIGLIATILFMIIAYKGPGVIAAISLLLYVSLYVMLLKIWPASLGGPIALSLSGMAGIALSVGLAVDGNVLIFERMREEIKAGNPLHKSVDLGFKRAWNAIFDSNITTLISCIILFNIGSSMIKGFAISLILGTLLSLFTAVTVTRTLLHAALLWKKTHNIAFWTKK